MATIDLFKSVPWSQGGFHVLRFPNKNYQDTYFDSLSKLTLDVDYEPRRGANLNLPISMEDIRQYTYIRWSSDDNPEFYRYFFIEDYEYLNDNPTVRLIISEDIWQGNHLNMSFAPGLVHRRHMNRWNGSTPILYPVDEGSPRSFKANKLLNLSTLLSPQGLSSNKYAQLIITSKDVMESHADGIYYYLTIGGIDGSHVNDPGGTRWVNGIGDFNSDFEVFGIGLAPVVAMYLIPMRGGLITAQGSGFSFTGGGEIVSNGASLFRITNGTVFSNPVQQDLLNEIPKPTKENGLTYINEPQMFSDNLRPILIVDAYGREIMRIPKDIALTNGIFNWSFDLTSLSPQIRIKWGDNTSISSTGLEASIPLIPLDISQSAWLDYVFQAQGADKQILENNISTRYITTAVGAVTGAASGAAYGGMYAESFNNSKRSAGKAGLAGLAMGAISGIGSLVNSYVQAGTDRDNFRLNEQKIKNTPTAPIGGNNPMVLDQTGGMWLVELVPDDTSNNIIYTQYKYYGYIVDESMSIPLRTRRAYDYIQLRDCTVLGNMTNDAKSYLEAIFNRGVTVWHAEAETQNMLNYETSNSEV